MMKRELFLFVAIQFLVLSVVAENRMTIEKVVSCEVDLSKEVLYNRGYNWVVSVFKNPQKVVQIKDKEGGQIVCKGYFEYAPENDVWSRYDATKGYIHFTVKLFFKDGRYKYVFTDFIHAPKDEAMSFGVITMEDEYPGTLSLSTKKWREWIWDDIKEQVEWKVGVIEASLLKGMQKVAEIEDESW